MELRLATGDELGRRASVGSIGSAGGNRTEDASFLMHLLEHHPELQPGYALQEKLASQQHRLAFKKCPEEVRRGV